MPGFPKRGVGGGVRLCGKIPKEYNFFSDKPPKGDAVSVMGSHNGGFGLNKHASGGPPLGRSEIQDFHLKK